MIRAVLFDFYGTLARATSWGAPYEEVLGAHGLTLSEDARLRWRQEVFDGQDHRQHSASRRHYEAWETDRLRRLAVACGGPDTPGAATADTDAIVADLFHASRDFVMEAYPEVPAVLAAVRASGRTAAVCSNWGWDLDRALDQAGLAPLVDLAVTSAQAGTRKPHPQIFHHTLYQCGVPPTEALFVGDTWGPDVEGPLAVGMRAVHVRRGPTDGPRGDDSSEAPEDLPAGALRIGDLTAVVDLLS